MNVSAISNLRRNSFIQYANSFMANPTGEEPKDKTPVVKPEKKTDKSMGIETLTIFPKEIIDGKTVITA